LGFENWGKKGKNKNQWVHALQNFMLKYFLL
jgi:hypothetical protein